MKTHDLLIEISNALDCESPIILGTRMHEIIGWDSLGVLSIVALLDSYGLSPDIEKIHNIDTIDQLIDMFGVVDE